AHDPDVPAGQLRLAHHAVGRPLPHRQATGGGDPQVAGGVFVDVPDEAGRERGGVGGVVLVHLEGQAVVAVEAVLGGQPDVPAPVLEDVHHRRLRQPLLEREVIEADRPDGSGASGAGHGEGGQRQRRYDRWSSFKESHQLCSSWKGQDGRAVPRPLRSMAANASGGTAGENRNPWYSRQPLRRRNSIWSSSSTPSATTRRPSCRAMAMVALVM